MNSKRALVSACLMFLAVACGNAQDLPLPPGEVAASNLPRELTAAPSPDLEKAVANNSDFAFGLYRKLVKGDENLFFSPHSITLALSMTYAGAAGNTTAAFETALQQTLGQSAYHRAMNDLDRQLTSRGAGAKAADGKAFRLTIANQLFAQSSFKFETPYLDLLAKEYGANVRLMNFIEQAEASRLEINRWVETRTENRIKDLLQQGTIDAHTRAVLVNAIYFNAAWRTPFDKNATKPGAFLKLGGGSTQVQMMSIGDVAVRGATVNGTEVIELPYDGDEMSALLLVPPSGQLPALEASLSAATLKTFISALKPEHLELSMPKFELRTSAGLKQPLVDLGLGLAFTEEADFSSMSKAAKLSVSDVVHEAFVKVDEAGTEAAAATAVIVGTTSIPVVRPVTVDRPFVLLVRDDATGAIVFAGRITSP